MVYLWKKLDFIKNKNFDVSGRESIGFLQEVKAHKQRNLEILLTFFICMYLEKIMVKHSKPFLKGTKLILDEAKFAIMLH